MFCPKCGKDVADGAKFCPSCGSQMNVESGEESTSENSLKEKQEQPQSAFQKFRSTVGLIVVGIVVLIGIIGSVRSCLIAF